jgi:transcriptional regulator with XRE-family HTH domain
MDHSDIMRNYRKQHKLTQTDLAKKLGVSQQVYSKFENGQKPKLDFVQLYLRYTGIDLSGGGAKLEARFEEYRSKIRELQFEVEKLNLTISNQKSEIAFLRGIVRSQSVAVPAIGKKKKAAY